MAFTRGWNNATPPGTRAAKQIDDAIRELKVDLSERLLAKLFSALPNDTVEANLVVRPEILGNVTARKLVFGPQGFQSLNDEDDTVVTEESFRSDNEAGKHACMALKIPTGVTITLFEATLSAVAGSVQCELYKVNLTTGAKTSISTVTRSGTSPGIASSAALSEAVDGSAHYGVRLIAPGQFISCYGIRITVTVPDCRSAS